MMQQWDTTRAGRWADGIDYASFTEISGKTSHGPYVIFLQATLFTLGFSI
jgi:hypothetical protein